VLKTCYFGSAVQRFGCLVILCGEYSFMYEGKSRSIHGMLISFVPVGRIAECP
jgi:hypothetical protein